ncbi:MAG: adenylate kinase family protein [Candidatus Heimdallarchaeota archaeon]
MTEISRVILLSGTPGTGKTSISKLLEVKGYTVLSLNEFIVQNGLYFGYDYSRESVIIDEELVLLTLRENLEKYPHLLIIEGHTAELIPKELVRLAFVLRCNPGILRSRLQSSRDYSSQKIEENIQAEIMEECLLGLKEIHLDETIIEIDTSKTTPIEVAEKIDLTIKGLINKICP